MNEPYVLAADEADEEGACSDCGRVGPVIACADSAVEYPDAPEYAGCGAWDGEPCHDCDGAGCVSITLCVDCFAEEPYDPGTDPKVIRNRELRARAREQGWKTNTAGANTKLTDPATGQSEWYSPDQLEAFLVVGGAQVTAVETVQCARCRRPSPEPSGEVPAEWEALGPDGEQVICDGCVTPEEQQALIEDMWQLAETTPLENRTDPRGDPL